MKKDLAEGADINSLEQNGESLLCRAVKENNLETAALLIDSGADVKLRNRDGNALIHYLAEVGEDSSEASYEKANELIRYIIAKGARVDEKGTFNNRPSTPLLIASKMNNWLGCRTLIDNGTDLSDDLMD